MTKIGILALQGNVIEHHKALVAASHKLGKPVTICEVRTPQELAGLDGIIIPGGESTAYHHLLTNQGMFAALKQVRKIFGTCTGAILLAKRVSGKAKGQRTLGLMDIAIARNAYGRQVDSFEAVVPSARLGPISGMFIRAPIITKVEKGVEVLAEHEGNPVIVYQKKSNQHLLAATFHPELAGDTKLHEFFLGL